MANYSLTEGALRRLMNGEKLTDTVMQILGSKKINSNNADKERYRILLSDGKNSISFAMLTTQISAGGIQTYSVIKIKKSVTSTINNINMSEKKVLLILDMELIASGDQVGKAIGNPVALEDDKEQTQPSISTSSTSVTTNGTGPSSFKVENSTSSALNRSISETRIISPIASVTPYHNKWVIKARVVNKSDLRTWSNSRGEGKLFSFDLLDESGEIRCTAFRDLAEKFFNYVQVDKVYYISKCQLKTSNPRFNQLKNDYEMSITAETIIEECTTMDEAIPQSKYNFVPINAIATKDVGALVDVIGICASCSDVSSFTSRTTNRELKKREIQLVDETKTSITLTLWGSQAENFDGRNNPVIVCKGAKVGEFGGGKNITVLQNTQFKLNPDIPQSFKIKGWYETQGRHAEMNNLSARTALGTFQSSWMTFKELQKQKALADKGEYYQNLGTIQLIRSENSVYKACPSADCNKKVVDQQNGMYRCEKCNREYPNFKYRLFLSMNIGNWDSNSWATVFADEAEKILGKTSEEVGHALENDSDQAANIFKEASFKQFIFKYRTKLEVYNDEERLKTVVVKAEPVNHEEYNSMLVDKIDKLLS